MHNILFDPALLVVPAETADHREVELWLKTLESWARVVGTTSQDWYHLTDLVVKHVGHERFPSFRLLRTLQQRFHLNIALPTIVAMVNEVFLQDARSFPPTLEAYLLQFGLIVEPTQNTVVIEPDALPAQWPGELRNSVAHLLGEAGVGKWKGEPFSSKVAIATAHHLANAYELRIAGEATILSERDEQEQSRFSAVFPLLAELEETVPTEVHALWELGEQGVRVAIERQFQQDWGATVARPLPFVIGPQFLPSVHERGTDLNRSVLTKIVYIAAAVIADSAIAINCDLHPLRETSAPNSPQRIRLGDGAKAWRLTLTNKGAGWRMHYWRIPGASESSIEFSNVCKKHESEVIF